MLRRRKHRQQTDQPSSKPERDLYDWLMFAVGLAGIIAVVATIWIGRRDQASSGRDVRDAIDKMAAIANAMQSERPLLQQQVAALSAAASAANRNADLARAGLEVQRQQTLADAAGRLTLSVSDMAPYRAETYNTLHFTVTNSGASEIQNASIKSHGFFGDYLKLYTYWAELEKDTWGDNVTIGPGQIITRKFYVEPISKGQFARLGEGGYFYFVMGEVIYTDRQHRRHKRYVCSLTMGSENNPLNMACPTPEQS